MIGLGLALGALFTGCVQQASDPNKKVVGVSLLNLKDDFYKDLEAGLLAAAQERGLELRINSAEGKSDRQVSQLETFIVQGVDAVIVSPVDSAGIAQSIRKLNKEKIPVFTADIAAQGGDVVCHVASDNVLGGELAAKTMAKLLDGQGEVIVIDHPEVTSVQDRVKGFMTEIAKSPGITVVDRPSAGGKRDRAFAITQNKLQAHPGLRGIFAINDDTALGALRAAAGSGVVIIGYDATPEAREAILSGGPLKADVIQYPDRIGKRVVGAVADYLSKAQLVPGHIPTEVGIVDQEALQKGN